MAFALNITHVDKVLGTYVIFLNFIHRRVIDKFRWQ